MAENNIGLPVEPILSVLCLLVLLLFIGLLVLWIKLGKLRKQYKKLMNGAGDVNVEQLLVNMQHQLDEQHVLQGDMSERLNTVSQSIKRMKSKVGIHRYNAFSDMGSQLSFTVAILDEYEDGILITGIHSRQDTYIYAKPVEKGDSPYSLSPEEKEAITLTLGQK
ncbi:DUF4446 family protein [Paenibacillus lutrae]|uniref:DUF4446 family protein n=1 Tax=Paenibacillus lutrae TaxID=2078573 RepID=A0A7X3FJB0_9BACL|nr:DUF4446 family protein [Paenibacillus lutrae]MVP00755.1 DUF4446 family protein [Paenibacillus lutrae]